MRERRVDYKTKDKAGLMIRRGKSAKISQIQRLTNRIVELENRVNSLEKQVRVLKRTVFQKMR